MKIYNGMQFTSETDRRTLSKIIEKFDEFTIGEVNETSERYVFKGWNQGQDKSIDAYITALRSLAKTWWFCDCLADSLLRDCIVFGIKNHALRKRLLQERNLDVKKCIDLCRNSEAASSQIKNISGASSTTDDVHRLKVQPTKPPWKQKYDRNAKHHKHQKRKICKFFTGNHPLKKELCPAWQKRCQKCKGRNHFTTVCEKGHACGVHGLSEQPELDSDEHNDSYESSDYEFLAVIAVGPSIHAVERPSGYAREIYTEMMINDKKIKFQINCGASINIITKCHTTKSHVTPSNKTLKMWNGTEMKLLGTTRLKVTNPKTRKKYSIEFVVVPDDLTLLLGARTAQQMELITVHEDHFVSVLPPQKKSREDIRSTATADELVRRYPEVFAKGLGTLPGTVHLRVDENAEPSVTPSRRIPTALREKFKAELDRLENLGVLAKVGEPTAWVNSVVIATKKSGALRISIDPRPLNQALKKETHQLQS